MADHRQADTEPTDVNEPVRRPGGTHDRSVPVEPSTDVQEAEAHPS